MLLQKPLNTVVLCCNPCTACFGTTKVAATGHNKFCCAVRFHPLFLSATQSNHQPHHQHGVSEKLTCRTQLKLPKCQLLIFLFCFFLKKHQGSLEFIYPSLVVVQQDHCVFKAIGFYWFYSNFIQFSSILMDCSISITTLFIGSFRMQSHTTVMSVFCLIIPVVGISFGNHFLTIQISLQQLLRAASNSCQSAIIKQASHLFSKKIRIQRGGLLQ